MEGGINVKSVSFVVRNIAIRISPVLVEEGGTNKQSCCLTVVAAALIVGTRSVLVSVIIK